MFLGVQGLMETVQLQCGNCQKLMAISVEHLGNRVQCPHCQAVVQTPKPEPPPAQRPTIPAMNLDERDSIFAGPEVTEDILGGGGGAPKFEPKLEPKREPARSPLPFPPVPLPPEEPTESDARNGGVPSAAAGAVGAPSTAVAESPADEPLADAELPVHTPRPIYERNLLPLLALIFLVPYSILATMFILYYLLFPQTRPHPLDMLPDPAPRQKEGGPRPISYQTLHNMPLAEHQKTPIGKTIRPGKDGDLLVTPVQVRVTREGDLELVLQTRNISANSAFEPIHERYIRYQPSQEKDGGINRPYTFLESTTKTMDPLYGAYLDYRIFVKGKEEPASRYLLSPKEEELVVLKTTPTYRGAVADIVKSKDSYVWRVQVRRGFVKYQKKDKSTTAVIGVEFDASQIQQAS
jgi:hypothetical protein